MDSSVQKLIVALDDLDAASALSMVEKTRAYARTFKVGLNLFCAHGPAIVREIKSLGVDIFLDVKLHDIPMQVAKALESVLKLEPRFVTIHAAGGTTMLQYAAQAVAGSSTNLLAVSVLTSINYEEYQRIGLVGTVADGVMRLTDLAFRAGIGGFVCSPHEAKMLKAAFQNQCFLVCPGIRSPHEEPSDQARTMSAVDAILAGADALVVGRPITKAHDVTQAACRISQEIESVLS